MSYSIRSLGRVAAALLLVGCASARPEQKMSVTAADGRLVPLDSITTSFTVGGVHVILRPNYATDAVAVNLYLLGGTRQLTPATQGIEPLLRARLPPLTGLVDVTDHEAGTDPFFSPEKR